MDQNDKLNELIEIVSQNQKTLKKMYRNLRFQTIIKTTYWVVVILGLIGAYLFLKPTYKVIKSNLNDMQNVAQTEMVLGENPNNLKSFLNPNGTFIKVFKNFFNLN